MIGDGVSRQEEFFGRGLKKSGLFLLEHGDTTGPILRWNRVEEFRRTFGRLGKGKVWTRVKERRRIRSPQVDMM